MTPRSAFAVVLFPVVACAPSSPRPIDFGPLSSLHSDSCYALAVGPWSGPFPSGWPEIHQPPDTFAITSHSSSWDHAYFEVRPGLPVLKGKGFAMWKPISADSLTITWSSGFSGVSLAVVVHSDTLVGVATAFYDVIGPTEPQAPVKAARIACSGDRPSN